MSLSSVVPKLTTAMPVTSQPLHLSPYSSELALDLNLIGRQLNGVISGISGLEANRDPIAVKMLQGGAAAGNESADDRALPEPRRIDDRFHQHNITVSDMGIHHGVAIHCEGKETSRFQNRSQIQAILNIIKGFHQATGSNCSQNRNP